MAAHNAAQSLRNLLIAVFVIGFLTTSCKKSGNGSDVVVDPRDQYVGVYEGGAGGYSSTITFGTFPTTETGPASITVSKGANAKEIYLDISTKPRLTAKLDDTNASNFGVIDKTSDQINVIINGKQYTLTGNYSATGVFGKDQASGKDQIVINTTAETLEQGTAIKRTESINGLRK